MSGWKYWTCNHPRGSMVGTFRCHCVSPFSVDETFSPRLVRGFFFGKPDIRVGFTRDLTRLDATFIVRSLSGVRADRTNR